MAPGDTHRLIVSSIRDLVPLDRCGPQLVLDSLLERNHLPPRGRPHKGLVRQAEFCHKASVDDARMDRRRRDLWVTPCDLRRIQNVGEFGLAVADPVANHGEFLRGAYVGEVDAVAWVALEPEGCVGDDADVGAGLLCRLEHGWQEQFDEESVADVVGSELDLVAVRSQGRWVRHDAGIAEQDVEAGGLRGEVLGCGGDGGERGEVTLDEVNSSAGDSNLDVLDGLVGGLLVAAGEIDVFWIVLGELFDAFCA